MSEDSEQATATKYRSGTGAIPSSVFGIHEFSRTLSSMTMYNRLDTIRLILLQAHKQEIKPDDVSYAPSTVVIITEPWTN